jgi:hypothetical protein
VLRLTVEDRFGNPVSTTPVVTAARGRVVAVEERAPGEYAVRYVAPAVKRTGEDELVARVGGVRAGAAPLLAPPAPALLVAARAGFAADLTGRFSGGTGGVVVQRPADVALAVRHGAELSWRLEAEGLSGRSGAALGAVLAGAGLRRDLGRAAHLELALAAGALVAAGEGAAAARLSLAVGTRRGFGVPFVEASLLGARAGAPGAFAALGLSAGVRFGVETSHGNDPHRR